MAGHLRAAARSSGGWSRTATSGVPALTRRRCYRRVVRCAWTLVVNKDAHTFHTNYRASRDFGRVAMQKRTLPSLVEQLTFTIEQNPSGPGGRIVMSWATT